MSHKYVYLFSEGNENMVFGNTGDTSGTGVAFTRNPATGEKKLFGEFLLNAQGEDVVAGVRTPQQIDQLANMASLLSGGMTTV